VTDRRLDGDSAELAALGACMLAGDELGFSLKRAFKTITSKKTLKRVFSKKNLKGVLKVAKVVGGAVAIVCPPAGGAIAGAAIAADKVLGAAGKAGSIGKAAKDTIAHTKALADAGDPGAARAVVLLKETAALRARKGIKPGQNLPTTPAARAAFAASKSLVVRPVQARVTGLQAAQLITAAKEGTPQEKASARAVYARTRARAAQGDPAAAKQIVALKAAAGAYARLQGPAAAPVRAAPGRPIVFVVNAQGRVLRRRAA
jgi:hypothetical protein